MTPGEARLALERHATSKLRSLDDLRAIATYGFRGEALPSIASVSRMRLRTRAAGADAACEIALEGGRVLEEREVGGPPGTRIEVADLFATVPARRKFLKRPSTEWGHIADWVSNLALALPAIHFELARDGKRPLVWPGTADPLDRIASVLSEEEASRLVAVEWEEAAGHVQAFLSPPDHTRGNANAIRLFVNQRPVRDKVLRGALLSAYRDLLPRGRFPSAVLFLSVPPESVDVNVHPAKWEVRFADSQAIHRLVRHSVREAMAGRTWLGPGASASQPAAGASGWQRLPAPPAGAPEPAWRTRTQEGEAGAAPAAAVQPALVRDAAVPEGAPVDRERMRFGSLRLVGQVLASYLVVEGPEGVLLVDQHAAHERILYERLRAQWLGQGVAQQPLLAPETVEVGASAVAALAATADVVAHLGFDVEPFGEGAVVVRSLPALLAGRNPDPLIRELCDELVAGDFAPEGDAEETRLLAAVDHAFASLACHGARRAGDRLEAGEQRSLLDGLDAIPWAPCCPHGRPVCVALAQAEIERRFLRR